MPWHKSKVGGICGAILLGGLSVPAHAQQAPDAPAEIVFQSGTGDAQAAPLPAAPPAPPRVQQGRINCADLPATYEWLSRLYGKWNTPLSSPDVTEVAPPPPPQPADRLDRNLLSTALASYRRHNCPTDAGSGPASIIVVDFARPSSQPRLYAINLLTGKGIDQPIAVAHGIGSDPDDNGIADRFSDVQDSLMSSIGAARGGELYYGQNGLSLRLDGLDRSNASMRRRDIVAHSYQPERRRYFNASLLADRRGNPGTSEGCFVVAPEYRDWLYSLLGNGGFLFAGLGGERAKEMDTPLPRAPSTGAVVFVSGTGE